MVKIDISAEPAAPPEAGVKVHVRKGEDMINGKNGVISERRYDGWAVERGGRKGIMLRNGDTIWLDTLLDDYITGHIGESIRVVISKTDVVRERK